MWRRFCLLLLQILIKSIEAETLDAVHCVDTVGNYVGLKPRAAYRFNDRILMQSDKNFIAGQMKVA